MNCISKTNLTFYGVLVWLVMLIVFVVFVAIPRQREGIEHERETAYRAWIKQTGNPKELTREEFLMLSKYGPRELK